MVTVQGKARRVAQENEDEEIDNEDDEDEDDDEVYMDLSDMLANNQNMNKPLKKQLNV